MKLSETVKLLKEAGIEDARHEARLIFSEFTDIPASELYGNDPSSESEELIDAVRYHSTGRRDMTLSEKIIYLSDYIEDTREYENCIALREEFFSSDIEKMSIEERLIHLDRVMLHAIELTVEDLTAIGQWLTGAKRYFLQQFVDSGDLIGSGLTPLTDEEMESMRQAVLPYIKETTLRGI